MAGGQLVREEGRDRGLALGRGRTHSKAELAVPGRALAIKKVARDTKLHLLEILEKLELESRVVLAKSDGSSEGVSGAVTLRLPAFL